MAEWRRCTIGDLCDAGIAELQTGPFGSQLHAYDYVEDGVPVVPTEAIRDRRIDHSVLPRISPRKAKELARHRLETGDILFARRGVQATGHIGCVRKAEDGFLCGTGAIRLRVRGHDGDVSPDFLSHVLANPASVEWFKFHAIGATMPNLNEGIIRSFLIQIPPFTEQQAIAHILGSLDDRIELNRRMNETLEAIARALFQSWFVDFDPVRAKAEGRDPGLPNAVADLFPDSFEDSELGEIPEGWRVGAVRDLAEINGKTLTAADALDPIDYIEISEVMRGDIGTVARYARGSEPSRARRCLRHGDSVLSTVRPDRGAHFLCLNPAETLIASTGFAVLSPHDGNWVFLYLAMTRREVGEELGRLADGGAYPAIRPEAVGDLSLVVPPAAVAKSFQEAAAPLLQRTDANRDEAKTIAALRDGLLPKLISGELRVKYAERIVTDAV